MNKNLIFKLLRYLAILGNIVFVLWILYNGIDEGFQGTRVQIASYIALILLLILILCFYCFPERAHRLDRLRSDPHPAFPASRGGDKTLLVSVPLW
jgi:amino acid permease